MQANTFNTSLFRICLISILLIVVSCSRPKETKLNNSMLNEVKINADLANEAFRRSDMYLKAWLNYADPNSKLIPRNVYSDSNIWNAKDAAADNYPFMVLTSFFTDKDIFYGEMLEILSNEKLLTARIGSLPDTYSFTKRNFQNPEIDTSAIIFGSAEYIKDGLLPITEWLGDSPWSERLIQIVNDLGKEVTVVKELPGFYDAAIAEVNGDLLQVLSRLFWFTGETYYLNWGIQIAEEFLFINPIIYSEVLNLRDHGGEIVNGLCELYIALYFTNHQLKKSFKDSLIKLLDRILEVGRNDSGFFFNRINPLSGEIINDGIADTWGYILNGYYTIWKLEKVDRYHEAVMQVFGNLNLYENYGWEVNRNFPENKGSADGYADAIESAINLYNRESIEEEHNWIDSQIKIMWSKQQSTGIIEGWHGDGNFARTSLMYALMKTQGMWIERWRKDIKLGTEKIDEGYLIYISADNSWMGKLFFDRPRHKEIFNMPIDYPRINQFPEWFTVDKDKDYMISFYGEEKSGIVLSGSNLINGFSIKLDSDNQYSQYIILKEN